MKRAVKWKSTASTIDQQKTAAWSMSTEEAAVVNVNDIFHDML